MPDHKPAKKKINLTDARRSLKRRYPGGMYDGGPTPLCLWTVCTQHYQLTYEQFQDGTILVSADGNNQSSTHYNYYRWFALCRVRPRLGFQIYGLSSHHYGMYSESYGNATLRAEVLQYGQDFLKAMPAAAKKREEVWSE